MGSSEKKRSKRKDKKEERMSKSSMNGDTRPRKKRLYFSMEDLGAGISAAALKNMVPGPNAVDQGDGGSAALQGPSRHGLPYELLDDNDKTRIKSCVGLKHVKLNRKEAWVLRLPEEMELSLLHGRKLHLPCEPPEARHLHPAPNIYEDPDVDLLAYVRAHIPTITVGHIALERNAAEEAEMGEFRELTQEDEFVAKRMFVVGPRRPRRKTSRLVIKRAARFIAVGDDMLTLDQQRLAAAMEEGVPLWGEQDGWDGQQAGRKTRKRIAGWKVVSRGVPAPAEGALSDEEFEEEVFGAVLKKKEQQGEAAGGATDGCASEEEELEGADVDADDEAEPDPAELVDPDERFYSEEEEQQPDKEAELRAQLRDLDCGPEGLDIEQFLLRLPVKPEVVEQQQLVAYIRRKRASMAARRAARQARHSQSQYRMQQQQQQQQLEGQSTPLVSPRELQADQGDDDQSPAGLGPSASPAASQQISDLTISGDDSDDLTPEPSSSELDEDVNWDAMLPPYEPPVPIPMMLLLPEDIHDSLSTIEHEYPDVAMKLRNACHKRLVNWVDVAVQVNTAAMTDDDTELLVALLPLDEGDDEGEMERRQQVSRLLLSRAGPGRRPHFSTVDPGYVPYQPSDGPPVATELADEVGDPEDQAVSDWLKESGAGKRARLIDTTELRSRGFAWDSDPEEEQREGMQVVLPCGRVKHIP